MGPLPRLALTAALAVAVTAPAHAAFPPAEVVAGGGTVLARDVSPGFPLNLATDVQLAPAGLASNGGELLVSDPSGARAYRFTPKGSITPIAGTGFSASGLTVCPTTTGAFGQLASPSDVIAFGGSYLIVDTPRDQICSVDATTGDAGRFAGSPSSAFADGTAATVLFDYPVDLEPFSGGTSGFYVADLNNKAVRKYVAPNFTTVAGAPDNTVPPTDGATATAVDIGYPHSIAAINDTDFYFANEFDVYTVTSGLLHRVAGGGTAAPDDGVSALSAQLWPGSIQLLHDGGFLVGDGLTGKLLRVLPDGTLSSVGDTPLGAGDMVLTDHELFFTTAKTVERLPATYITAGPGEFSGSTTLHFEFGSWDENATFACDFNNAGVYTACASDYVVPGEGKYLLRVKATTDDGTRVDSGLVRAVKVDLTQPGPFDLLAPAADSTVSDPKPTFSWTPSTDPNGVGGSGVDHYDLVIDGSTVATVPGSSCSDTCSAGVPAALADGRRTWRVVAVDGVGNSRAAADRGLTVAVPPVAALTLAPSRALAGRSVAFDASASTDANGGIADYAWDLDGDGAFETDTGAAATTTKTYASPATLDVKVRVTDTGGLTSVAQQTLVISAQAPAGKPLGVSINDGAQYTNDPKVTIFAVWPSFASNAFVSNDGGFKNGVLFPVAEKIPWTLDSSGPERLPKTIYVRFQSGPQTSETYTDDIILDQTPPKLLSASLSSGGGAAAAAAAKATLKLKATDNVSGVGGVQVTKNKRKPGRFLKYKKTLKVVPAKTLYVRVRDRAGNLSAWRVAKRH